MTREELETYISEEYGADGESLWAKYPGYEVFRHKGNQKWFAILMDIPEEKLGKAVADGSEARVLDILDVKCEPLLIASLCGEPGYFPAYHMNKNSWISIDIGRVEEEKIKGLLEMSYGLTAAKRNVSGKKAAGARGQGKA